jgi:hypothetical protein
MFLRPYRLAKDGKVHAYWSLVETVRTPEGPGQRTVMLSGGIEFLGAIALGEGDRGLQRAGRAPAVEAVSFQVPPPENAPDVARVWVKKMRLERVRQFGNCFLGLEL